MAPKGRPMKRPAAEVEVPVAKKPAVAPPETVTKKPAGAPRKAASKSCSLVAKAVAKAPGYSPEVLLMLSNSLPQCLGPAKEERHAFQARIVEMIGEVLRSSEASMQAELKAADERVSKAEADKAGLETEEASGKAAAEEKAEGESAAKAALDESISVVDAARDALSQAQDEQKAGDAALEAAAERQATLTSTKTDVFDPLKKGGVEIPTENVSAMLAIAGSFSFDASLLQALPTALGKAPDGRSTFDGIVLEQAEAEFQRCLEVLQETISSGDDAKSERAGKVAAASAELEQALEAEKARREALKAAKAQKKEVAASRKVTSKALQALGPELKRAAAELERASAGLEDFRTGPLLAYRELAERPAVAPAVWGEAGEEEAAAPEGETAAAE